MAIRKLGNRTRPKKTPFDHLDELIKNGLQFVERGAKELWDEDDRHHLKYSVINFYSGVELLLKARLMHDHWALIVIDIRQCDADQFVGGNFQSVGLGDTISRLKKICGVEMEPAAEKCFESIRKHRNRMVHFYHTTDQRTKESRALKERIIKEQCSGWFFLRRLLQDSWKNEFEKFQDRISIINGHMKRHAAYLATVYDKIKPELDAKIAKGSTLGHCYSCNHDAHLVDEAGPFQSNCQVCTAYGSFLAHSCKQCKSLFLVEDGFDGEQECPNCSELVTLNDLFAMYSDEGGMTDKDLSESGGYGNCAECGGYHTVGTINDDDSFCFSCHQLQGPMGVCDYCGEKATGNLEDSYLVGCVVCHGSFD